MNSIERWNASTENKFKIDSDKSLNYEQCFIYFILFCQILYEETDCQISSTELALIIKCN